MKNLFKLHIDNLARTKQPVNLVKNEDGATLYIYDIISSDWGVSALSVIDSISQAGDAKTLNIRISSPGGDVFESRAIMAAIARFPGNTVAHIDGVCASAATSIALSCGEVAMSEGGFFMIHNASGMAWGDKQALRDTADLLEKVEGVIVSDYTNKTGKDAAEIVAMMDAETWLDAETALSMKFADRIATKAEKVNNAWDLSAYSHAPKIENETIEPPIEVVTANEPSIAARLYRELQLMESELV